MKNMRKLFAMVLAIMLVMSLATTGFAASNTAHTITIENATSGYTYEAYQVFSGDLETVDSKEVLTNVAWGAGVNAEGLITDLKQIAAFADCETAEDVVAVLSKETDNSATVKAFAAAVGDNLSSTVAGTSSYADSKYTIPVTGDGYYFVKNTAVPTTDSSYTRYILEVVKDVKIQHKGTYPSVDKKIVEDDTMKDTADYTIGETITFRLIGTLPSNYADYETYKYVFTDTLSAGLTYTDSVKVWLGTATYDANGEPTSVTKGTEITSAFTANPASANTTGGGTVTVSCDNLKETAATASNVIIVEYTAVLNSSAVIGGTGNLNKVKLTYSNDPNFDGEGTPPTGDTPEDEVLVFTYELDVTKKDEEGNELGGAKFVLWNADKTAVAKVVNGKFVEWVTKDATTAVDVDDFDADCILTSAETTGLFTIAGLDQGTYYLREVMAPTGYNKLTADIKIVITASTSMNGITSLTISVDDGNAAAGNTSTGVVNTDVENKKGTTLPSTGGMGTTMFYLVGGMMVLAAVVLLVTKKRMASAE